MCPLAQVFTGAASAVFLFQSDFPLSAERGRSVHEAGQADAGLGKVLRATSKIKWPAPSLGAFMPFAFRLASNCGRRSGGTLQKLTIF
jgi:hypothetical protein